MRTRNTSSLLCFAASAFAAVGLVRADDDLAKAPLDFKQHVEPILLEYCFDCHGDGETDGDLSLDYVESPSLEAFLTDQAMWGAVVENLRSHTMPPSRKAQPNDDERALIAAWVQKEVFKVDCDNPDPGRVTIRRLNRNEYRNTIKDLFGINYDTVENFPADDTGFGFDNIGDALSLSPLLMEKYIAAASEIVADLVHTEGPLIPHTQIWSNNFRRGEGNKETAERMRFKEAKTFQREHQIAYRGKYKFTMKGKIEGSSEASNHTATIVLKAGGKEIAKRKLGWDNSRELTFSGDFQLEPGKHQFTVETIPGEPPADGENELTFRFSYVDLYGPLDGSHREYPDDYQKIFWDGAPPADEEKREPYARKLLSHYAEKIYRRPADEATVDRLAKLVYAVDKQDGKLFEHGIAQALTAMLASPRFLFRAEVQAEPNNPDKIVPIDEYALASRLSYFLWSSLPDDELFRAAREGTLRKNLRPQVQRMIADPKFERFVESFVGQWLQARDIMAIPADSRRILGIRDSREANKIWNHWVKTGMEDELQLLFQTIAREDLSVLDLIDPDFTFVNKELARFYGLPEPEAKDRDDMVRVSLPEGSARGGVLASGGMLLVTSNPTRTSPVKRGLFVLDNILGTPAPPAPPDVPELGEAFRQLDRDEITMRKLMEIHREKPICASCHARMDPIGLALENFNALGQWRDTEKNGQKIDSSGELITGEKFSDVRELKKIVTGPRRPEFYRCLADKLMTYALGRGTEYYDTCTLDAVTDRLESSGGKFSELLMGIIESPAFQKRRGDDGSVAATESAH